MSQLDSYRLRVVDKTYDVESMFYTLTVNLYFNNVLKDKLVIVVTEEQINNRKDIKEEVVKAWEEYQAQIQQEPDVEVGDCF